MVLVPLTVTTNCRPSGVNPTWAGERGNEGGFKPHWKSADGAPVNAENPAAAAAVQLTPLPVAGPGSIGCVESTGVMWPSSSTRKPVIFGPFAVSGCKWQTPGASGPPAFRT